GDRRAGPGGAPAGAGRRPVGPPARRGVLLPPAGAGGHRPADHGSVALRDPDAARRAAPAVRRPRHLRRRRERVRPRRLLGRADQHPGRRKGRAMTLLLSAWTVGLLLALLALGVYVSFRVFSFPDITVDGSFTLGASVAAVLMTDGPHPILANLHSVHLWPG